MRRLWIPVVVLGSVLVACAHDEPIPQPGEMPAEAKGLPVEGRFVLTGIPRPVVALITPSGVQGAPVSLGRYDNGNALRGTVYGRDVNISVSNDMAEGLYGRSPFNLKLSWGEDGAQANGLVGGTISTFTFNKARINGNFGHCGYDVRFQGQGYVGQRSCGGSIQQVAVTLPPILTTWRDAEVATVLALLLSGR
jgi:hypothetical protein